jgi:Zn ribbon nucleic-acid-binding protein
MKYKAFVCPECGYIDRDGDIIVENWKEIIAYSYDPETLDCQRNDSIDTTVIELASLECFNCGWEEVLYPDSGEGEAYAIETLRVEIEESNNKLVATPIGSYWKQRPSKLAEVLSNYLKESEDEEVEVIVTW